MRTVLVDGEVYLFETGLRDTVLGYYYRRKRIQERYDKLYGVKSRVKRKLVKKLKERKKKSDVRWKIANIVVGVAKQKRYAIVLEKLGENPAREMIVRIEDDQLKHRIYQASFRGIQIAIEEKAKECEAPVVYVDPRNTSRLCPIHKTPITYNNSRIGRCSTGKEFWHRDVAACWNLFSKPSRVMGAMLQVLESYI